MSQHQTINNPHILELIKECIEETESLGYHVPSKLRFMECDASRRAGQANHPKQMIILSKFIYKESDRSIKSVIYHEIGHIVAGPYAHHGPVWKKIVKKMTERTGIPITRCYSNEDMPVHTLERQSRYKYHFQCTGCGCRVGYIKKTKFVDTYADLMSDGSPRWTCRRCGGTFKRVD